MNEWQDFDDYMIYNEKTKTVIQWCTYGDNQEYFLNQEYTYIDDMFDFDGHKDTLINEKITPKNTLAELIERTKNMK